MNELRYQTQENLNTIQIKLPLEISVKIKNTDPVVTFKEVMEGVNLKKYLVKQSNETRGRDGYDPEVLLKIVLFAYMINVRSTRKIESLCQNDIRLMYLSDEATPTHMTIGNFINTYLLDNIENISNDIVKYIIEKRNIDIRTIFIDGTKIEAFPNKYTWVWKNACITNRDKQFKYIEELFKKINNDDILALNTWFEVKSIYNIEELEEYLNRLKELANNNNIKFVRGKGKRKKNIQKYYEKLKTIIGTLKEYANKIDKCGDGRNSYSKTDVDATFMRMKTDYMGNTALLPAYNWQLVTCGELILYGLTAQTASDGKCFIPLMNKYKEIFGYYPDKAVADAAYGNMENYRFCDNNKIGKYMKYQTWEKETHDKKFIEDPFRSVNFKKDSEGNMICPNNKRFFKLKEESVSKIDDRIVEYYQCEDCSNCPFRDKCNKENHNRVIKINEELTSFHQEVINNLASEEGIKLRCMRSSMSEGTFGVIKQDYNYKRITRKTLKKVNLEFYLIIIGFNLAKYHNLKNKIDYLPC